MCLGLEHYDQGHLPTLATIVPCLKMSPLMDDGPARTEDQEQTNSSKDQHREQEAVAIIGYSYRFPEEAINDEQFWQLLMDKRCAMAEFPSDRMNVSRWCHPDKKRRGQMAPRGGCFLREDVSLFDAPFFGLPADEAAALDPQQRHVLEVTYAALENGKASRCPKLDVSTNLITSGYTHREGCRIADLSTCGLFWE